MQTDVPTIELASTLPRSCVSLTGGAVTVGSGRVVVIGGDVIDWADVPQEVRDWLRSRTKGAGGGDS
jgi:hypothetical protein